VKNDTPLFIRWNANKINKNIEYSKFLEKWENYKKISYQKAMVVL
jgi:hypothetical protein